MAYELTEEQQLVRQTIRKLASEKVAPRAAAIDAEDKYPWDILGVFRQNDLMGIAIPREYGGGGLDGLTCCLILEELARVSLTASIMVGSQELGSTPLLLAGSPEQRQYYLPRLASGEVVCAFALTEPEAGSDAAATRTRVRKDGDIYVLNGRKCFITNGGIAGLYTVFATVAPERGVRGITAFLVESDTPGFQPGKIEDKMGIRGSQTAELLFEECPVPKANLLGEEGQGFKIAMATLDRTRPAVAAQAVGLAQGAFDYAREYCLTRQQFGQPIARLQGLQFMLADMATQIEAARQLVYYAAGLVEREITGDMRPKPQASRISAMSKLFASDVAMRVTTDAVQLLGGYGYMKDYPVERMMRDAKITQIIEGTNQVQRLVIADTLTR